MGGGEGKTRLTCSRANLPWRDAGVAEYAVLRFAWGEDRVEWRHPTQHDMEARDAGGVSGTGDGGQEKREIKGAR